MFGIIRLVLIASMLGGVAYGFQYISTLQRDLAVSKNNTKVLEESVAQQKAFIEQQEKNYQLIVASNKAISDQLLINQDRINTLNNKFDMSSSGKPRDLNELALAKPKLVEKVINKASENAIRCIEIVTGSPLTEQELAVTKRSEANNECPHIHPLLGDSAATSLQPTGQ